MNILGVDIGGTAVKLGLVDASGQIMGRAEHSVSFNAYQTPIIQTALASAAGFIKQSGYAIAGVAISATGQIDSKSGMVVGTCGNLPGWIDAPLKAAFEEMFHQPTTVMNDANCALLGESWVGGAVGFKNVLMVTLGTGVGGGVLVDGKILKGARGLGGELGHMSLKMGERLCTCGNTGCYEQYASVTALLGSAGERLGKRPANAKILFNQAEQGDEAVLALLDAWQDDIAQGLIGLTHVFNPEMILLGGGVCRQEKLLIKPLREKVLKRVMPRFSEGLQIKAASLGNDAGLIGAVRYWLDERKGA